MRIEEIDVDFECLFAKFLLSELIVLYAANFKKSGKGLKNKQIVWAG